MEKEPGADQKQQQKAQQLNKQRQTLDRRQLMINMRKLQLQRKSVQQAGSGTDMHLQTQSFKSFGRFISERSNG